MTGSLIEKMIAFGTLLVFRWRGGFAPCCRKHVGISFSVMALGMSGLATGVRAEVLVDARWVKIDRQDHAIHKSVRHVRIFSGDFAVGAESEWGKEWSFQTIDSGRLESVLSGMDMTMKREYWTCLPEGINLTVGTTSFDAAPGPLLDRWWASYVGAAAGSGATHREFVLYLPEGDNVTYAAGGTWDHSQRIMSNGNIEMRWVAVAPDLKQDAIERVVPWVLVGSRTTWDVIGARLRDIMVTSQRRLDMTAPPACNDLSSLLSYFDDFKREAPTAGFRPRPQTDFLASRSGTCKEFSLALAHMLEAQGQSSWLVFRATGVNDLADIIPSPKVFDHVEVAVVDKNGQLIILDPFAARMREMSGVWVGHSVWTHGNRLFVPYCSANITIVRKRR